jgi:hypothetical protein
MEHEKLRYVYTKINEITEDSTHKYFELILNPQQLHWSLIANKKSNNMYYVGTTFFLTTLQ